MLIWIYHDKDEKKLIQNSPITQIQSDQHKFTIYIKNCSCQNNLNILLSVLKANKTNTFIGLLFEHMYMAVKGRIKKTLSDIHFRLNNWLGEFIHIYVVGVMLLAFFHSVALFARVDRSSSIITMVMVTITAIPTEPITIALNL